ncbi:MAG: hypothetical protein ACRDXX_00700 [Stackebrandtia sp.]
MSATLDILRAHGDLAGVHMSTYTVSGLHERPGFVRVRPGWSRRREPLPARPGEFADVAEVEVTAWAGPFERDAVDLASTAMTALTGARGVRLPDETTWLRATPTSKLCRVVDKHTTQWTHRYAFGIDVAIDLAE